ncbi:Pre-mRNA-splicing factor slt11 [Rhizina undulata]
MPPGGTKSDINRSGRESTDFPSVCESCLPDSPYIQMIKENQGMECKICTRPFTVFRWSADRTSRFKKTNICLTCARLKNCCQCCMLDLSFGLPIAVRDAALKLVAQGPSSSINKEYYAQNHEGSFKDGQVPEEYEKTDSAARDLLKRLAHSEPYYKRRRNPESGESAGGTSQGAGGEGQKRLGPGPIRTGRGGAGARGGRGGNRGGRGGRAFHSNAHLPPGPQDILPPDDKSITSLFLTGVEDDLAEHNIRTFFSAFGQIKSIVCVHRSRCAFVNFQTRAGAEAAAESCQGKAVIAGCPLRIQWGKTRPLGNIDRSQAAVIGRSAAAATQAFSDASNASAEEGGDGAAEEPDIDMTLAPKPPGVDDVQYPSQLAS